LKQPVALPTVLENVPGWKMKEIKGQHKTKLHIRKSLL